MSEVKTINITAAEAGQRLDRWFKGRFPGLGHGRLEKLLRTGQIRVDGKRATAGQRLQGGQTLRVPPLGDIDTPAPPPLLVDRVVTRAEADALLASVLYKDEHMLAIDKPAGLAVQGGTGTTQHIDGMLDVLRFDAPERPRLVHRLDKDTSGVLVLARSGPAAASLAEAFRHKTARKIYWALVAGVPKLRQGRIDLSLAKLPGRAGEKMAPDEDEGKRAITYYKVIDHAGKKVSWVALMPQTGRTHQLRVHCAYLGTPILGDGKYGGAAAFVTGAEGVAKKLHLHARQISIPHPDRLHRGGDARNAEVTVTAPLPEHMLAAWNFFGFDPDDSGEPFLDLDI